LNKSSFPGPPSCIFEKAKVEINVTYHAPFVIHVVVSR